MAKEDENVEDVVDDIEDEDALSEDESKSTEEDQEEVEGDETEVVEDDEDISEEGEDEEEGLEFDAWKAQWDLDENIKSEEDLARAHLDLRKSSREYSESHNTLNEIVKVANQLGFSGGPKEMLAQLQNATTNQQGQPMTTPANNRITNLSDAVRAAVNSGLLDEEEFQGLQRILPIFDHVLGNITSGISESRALIDRGLGDVQKNIADDSDWLRFKDAYKDESDNSRDDLRKLKNKHNFGSYEEALMWKRVNNPDWWANAKKGIEKQVEKKVYKKLKNPRFNKTSPSKNKLGGNKSKYIDNSGNVNFKKLEADLDAGKIDDKFYDSFLSEIADSPLI